MQVFQIVVLASTQTMLAIYICKVHKGKFYSLKVIVN